MTAAERAERAEVADALCVKAFEQAGCPENGVALVAVGGYGREELAPYSDLDVVLVHDADVESGEWAGAIWYPLWDSGMAIDHSVRTLDEVLEQSAADLKVALGMLDVRHLAGDPNLTLRLRTRVLAAWRKYARRRLPELRELVNERARRVGELADIALPDLKESIGGLRDATVLKALVATWLVDVPHTELERARTALLDVRDALQTAAGRATDRVTPEYWGDVAEALGLENALAAQRFTRAQGRRLTHVSRLTWRQVDGVLRTSSPAEQRRPKLRNLGDGVAIGYDEIVLGRGADPKNDPLLLFRCAAIAAERRLVLAPATAARLMRDCPPLPEPWPAEARDLFVRLLIGGQGLLEVWETLEETGVVARILPEWDAVRLLPSAATVHRYTVDRHQMESCIEASHLIRRVGRPDILAVAALLHDIGKGWPGEHCSVGEPIARSIALRWGFNEADSDRIATLVRLHLLLPDIATTRDIDDPATIEKLAEAVRDREELELLFALTEADARATSEKAWTSWRASLVRTLVRRTANLLAEGALPVEEVQEVLVPDEVLAEPLGVSVEVVGDRQGSLVTVMSRDRVGLLADAAGMLAVQKIPVRAARIWTQGDVGISEWSVDRTRLEPGLLRKRLEQIVAGQMSVAKRLGPPEFEDVPHVVWYPEASHRATVLEVRAANQTGVVYRVCAALAGLGLTVRSAHVNTLGPQAVDVFYVQEPHEDEQPLSDERAVQARETVKDALR